MSDHTKPAELAISLSSVAVTRFFTVIVVSLLILHGIGLWVYFALDGRFLTLIEYVDFGVEGNIPTFYSALALAFAGMLGFLVAGLVRAAREPGAKHWAFLGLVFLYLAVDEAAQLHELVGYFMKRVVDATGVLYFPWVVPYAVLTLLLALVYRPFIWTLPSPTRHGLMLAAAVFLSGALGLEILSALEMERSDDYTLRYCLTYTAEELLEMAGVVLYIRTLCRYIESRTGRLVLRLGG